MSGVHHRATARMSWFVATVTQVIRSLRWLDELLSRRTRRRPGDRLRP
jgi:hypothetical protein